MAQLTVGVVGLSFGASFIPIYLDHPDVCRVIVCDTDPAVLEKVQTAYPKVEICSCLDALLENPSVDAVHLITPIPQHAEQIIKVLKAGKHCACTVPIAISLEALERIGRAIEESGKIFMMMETTLYTYQFLYVQKLLSLGALGKIQFLRGSHYQDMDFWPSYWTGLPPFWYGTHAISPMRVLAGEDCRRVICFGSGSMAADKVQHYGNPYPVESALFDFGSVRGEATRSLFETARVYQEGMFVYGSRMSFEWGFADGSRPWITRLENPSETQLNLLESGIRGRATPFEAIDVPNSYEDLPESIRKYTVGKNYDATNPQNSLRKGAGGGHHGAHPHLVHEFVSSIRENRNPTIDFALASNITASCICAHESAMKGGVLIDIPSFV